MKTFLSILALACIAFATAQTAEPKACCAEKKTVASKDSAFLAEANRMVVASEGKKACCRTTATVAVAKGEAGCCNAKGAKMPYKIYVSGAGYKFFGCPDSAKQERIALVGKGKRVGPVQKVSSL